MPIGYICRQRTKDLCTDVGGMQVVDSSTDEKFRSRMHLQISLINVGECGAYTASVQLPNLHCIAATQVGVE